MARSLRVEEDHQFPAQLGLCRNYIDTYGMTPFLCAFARGKNDRRQVRYPAKFVQGGTIGPAKDVT